MGAIIVGPGVNCSIQLTPAAGRLNCGYCDYAIQLHYYTTTRKGICGIICLLELYAGLDRHADVCPVVIDCSLCFSEARSPAFPSVEFINVVAPDEVKAVAHYVTLDVDHSGLAAAINKFLL